MLACKVLCVSDYKLARASGDAGAVSEEKDEVKDVPYPFSQPDQQ